VLWPYAILFEALELLLLIFFLLLLVSFFSLDPELDELILPPGVSFLDLWSILVLVAFLAILS